MRARTHRRTATTHGRAQSVGGRSPCAHCLAPGPAPVRWLAAVAVPWHPCHAASLAVTAGLAPYRGPSAPPAQPRRSSSPRRRTTALALPCVRHPAAAPQPALPRALVAPCARHAQHPSRYLVAPTGCCHRRWPTTGAGSRATCAARLRATGEHVRSRGTPHAPPAVSLPPGTTMPQAAGRRSQTTSGALTRHSGRHLCVRRVATPHTRPARKNEIRASACNRGASPCARPHTAWCPEDLPSTVSSSCHCTALLYQPSLAVVRAPVAAWRWPSQRGLLCARGGWTAGPRAFDGVRWRGPGGAHESAAAITPCTTFP